MKTGNTLRMAKNSLLCFFMTLAGGFLVACGSSSDGSGVARPGTPTLNVDTTSPPSFSAYLVDTAVEGVSYSGPTGNGETGKGGVFEASHDGVFEFSIGDTALGSVRMSINQADNEVTPSDFLGVDTDAKAITIARILQGLDLELDGDGMQEDRNLRNGISISQSARDSAGDLFALINDSGTDNEISDTPVGVRTYTIPSAVDARDHLVATRKCLFSGGYVGDYRATVRSDGGELGVGQVYYAVEPFANRARRFGFTGDAGALDSFDSTSTVGVIGSNISLDVGNALSFTTPRLVARGVWERMEGTVAVSGTHDDLTAVAGGNPGANRRIIGVQTAGAEAVAGMYVLDYFGGATVFRGRHYEVDATSGVVSSMALSLTIANGVSWPDSGMTTVTLTLSGMRGEDAASITVEVVRTTLDTNEGENYGSFEGVGNELSGTWCDIGGAVGSTVAPTPPDLTNKPTNTVIEITWNAVEGATVYKLYRSTVSAGSTVSVTYDQVGGDISTTTYTERRDSADTEYFYRLEACNSAGCSERSAEVRTNPPQDPPAAALVGSAQGEIEADWGVKSLAMSHSRIGGDVSAHRLSRYLDSGIDGVQILG